MCRYVVEIVEVEIYVECASRGSGIPAGMLVSLVILTGDVGPSGLNHRLLSGNPAGFLDSVNHAGFDDKMWGAIVEQVGGGARHSSLAPASGERAGVRGCRLIHECYTTHALHDDRSDPTTPIALL